MAAPEYKSLGGRGLRRQGFFSVSATRSRLYQAADHILCVDSQGYSEDYRRFYFRDIQAFVIRQNTRRRTTNFINGALFVLVAIPGIWANQMMGFWFSVAGLFLVAMLMNTLMGTNLRL